MCSFMQKFMALGEIKIEKNYDLRKLSSFGIGGNAKLVLFPKTKNELIMSLLKCRDAIVIGNGTNILFSDKGVSKPLITTREMTDEIVFSGNKVKVCSGTNLSKLCLECAKRGLGGVENLFGIPGTVGGAICMNAGAFGSEISSVVESVQVFRNGKVITLFEKDIQFAYRSSVFQTNEDVMLEVTLKLFPKDNATLENKIKENMIWRQEHQPSGKSAGSVFKKASQPAGLLIDKAGLKGLTVGGAIVSNKHANFIINNGNAKASDVCKLIKIIKDKVYMENDILLEEEIKYIGDKDGFDGRFSYPFKV